MAIEVFNRYEKKYMMDEDTFYKLIILSIIIYVADSVCLTISVIRIRIHIISYVVSQFMKSIFIYNVFLLITVENFDCHTKLSFLSLSFLQVRY